MKATINGVDVELTVEEFRQLTQAPKPASSPTPRAPRQARNQKILYAGMSTIPLGRREIIVFEVIREWDQPVEVGDVAPYCQWTGKDERTARNLTYNVCKQLQRKGIIKINGKTRSSDYTVEVTTRGRKIKYYLSKRGNYEMNES